MSIQKKSTDFHVTVRNETVPRTDVIDALLRISALRLTARELISERVLIECDTRLTDEGGRVAPLLIERSEKEKSLNGPIKHHVQIASGSDEFREQQVAIALRAFETNGFILLVDDRQIEGLDDEIEFSDTTTVTFLKLTPLVGG